MSRGREACALATLSFVLASCTQRERAAPPAPDAAQPAASSSVTTTIAASDPKPAVAEPPPAPSPRAPAPPAIPVADWVWKSYRGDGFSALFPGDPKLVMLPAEDDKLGYTEAVLDVPGGLVSFAVGFTDHPQSDVAKPDAFLDDHANAPRRGQTEILHKRTIALAGGHRGRVLIMRRNISGTPLKVYSRLYLVGRRLYSLIVSTLDVGGVSDDVVKKFMESFKLL